MAKTTSEREAEPDTGAAIVDECGRALNRLGARPGLLSPIVNHERDKLCQVLRKHGAKQDLLKIIGSGGTMDDQWVLTELRRWNTRAH